MTDPTAAILLTTVALPFGVALGVAAVSRFAGLPHVGLAVALGVLAGDFAGQAAVAGWPALPPNGSVDKLPWLILGGIALGLALQHLDDPRLRKALLAGALALAIVWVGWPRMAIPDTHAWLAGAVLWGLAVWTLGRVEAVGGGNGAVLSFVLVVAAAGIGLFSSSYSMAQLIGVLAVALAGGMLAAGRRGEGFDGVARLALAGPLVGLLAMLSLYTNAEPLALLLLAVVPLTTGLGERAQRTLLPDGAASTHPTLCLTVRGAVAVLPAAAAVAVAISRSGPLYY
jgi:hypothetical protein